MRDDEEGVKASEELELELARATACNEARLSAETTMETMTTSVYALDGCAVKR